ncbi:MAG: hypothetical protein AB7V36_09630 [Bacteroidales bacterium]
MPPDAKPLVAWVVAPPNGLGEASPSGSINVKILSQTIGDVDI